MNIAVNHDANRRTGETRVLESPPFRSETCFPGGDLVFFSSSQAARPKTRFAPADQLVPRKSGQFPTPNDWLQGCVYAHLSSDFRFWPSRAATENPKRGFFRFPEASRMNPEKRRQAMFGNLLKTNWGKVQACIMAMGVFSFLLLCVTVNCNCAFGKIIAALASSCCAAVAFWSLSYFLPEFTRRSVVKGQLLAKYWEIKRRLISIALKSLQMTCETVETKRFFDCATFDKFLYEMHTDDQNNWDAIVSDWSNNKLQLNDVRFLVRELADSVSAAMAELQCADKNIVTQIHNYDLTVKTVLNQSDYQDDPAKYIGPRSTFQRNSSEQQRHGVLTPGP